MSFPMIVRRPGTLGKHGSAKESSKESPGKESSGRESSGKSLADSKPLPDSKNE